MEIRGFGDHLPDGADAVISRFFFRRNRFLSRQLLVAGDRRSRRGIPHQPGSRRFCASDFHRWSQPTQRFRTPADPFCRLMQLIIGAVTIRHFHFRTTAGCGRRMSCGSSPDCTNTNREFLCSMTPATRADYSTTKCINFFAKPVPTPSRLHNPLQLNDLAAPQPRRNLSADEARNQTIWDISYIPQLDAHSSSW